MNCSKKYIIIEKEWKEKTMKEYLAFDVGGTSVKYALCNEEGKVSSASKFKTPDTLDQMYLEMEKVVHNYPNVEGIALSMPGAVDSDGGIIYGSSAIDYIHGPNIKEDLKQWGVRWGNKWST